MSAESILRDQVRQRAAHCCEYCQLPQEVSDLRHQIDHVVAEKHRGPTVIENLALSCYWCNVHKGPNVAGVDPESGSICQLFSPRTDNWNEHFAWQGPALVGKTATGRSTVEVLEINLLHRQRHRAALIKEGVFPPRMKEGS